MLRNYLTVALRTLRRNRGYTLINVGGLAVGLAACLLIGLYLRHEASYDRFHDGAERTYRLAMRTGPLGAFPLVPARAGRRIAQDFVPVEAWTRVETSDAVVLKDGRPVAAENFFYADASFFEVFDGFRLRRGDPRAALAEPGTAVVTPSAAARYLPGGGGDPIGKVLTLRDGATLRVTGVAEEPPSNSHLQFGVLASFATLGPSSEWSKYERSMGHQSFTYLQFANEAGAARLEAQLAELTDAGSEAVLERLGFAFTEMQFALQPLTEIHLRPFFNGKIQPEGSWQTLYVLALVALCVLLLAVVNYANLATARSTRRAREVGLRRTLGAFRRQVAGQFLGEAVLVALLAFAGAFVLARLLLPGFEAVMGADLAFGGTLGMAALLAGGALAVGLLAGAYPALVLSRFEPATVLAGGGASGRQSSHFRRGLVVFQFAVSIALVACTLAGYQQLRFTQEKDLGYESERVVTLPLSGEARERADVLKEEMRRLPGVASVSVATGVPIGSGLMSTAEWEGEQIPVRYLAADTSYLRTLGMRLVAGRNFRPGELRDTTHRYFIANETAARLFDLEDDVGGPLPAGLAGVGQEGDRLVGIVGDFHSASLREPIGPLFLRSRGHWGYSRALVARLAGSVGREAGLGEMHAVWARVLPDRPFAPSFLSERVASLYRAERRLAALTGGFTALAVFIACLGLFGLAAFAAERRRKEIAVRKTFGASVRQIVTLLSKDFLALVVLGALIATPLAYFAMRRWLEGFAYRIELGPLVFLAAGALALAVALLATGAQALRAARTNPAEALRDE